MNTLQTLAPIFMFAAAAGGIAYALLFPLLSGQKRAEERMRSIAPTDTVAVRQARGAAATQRSKRDSVAQSLKELDQREKARGKVTLEDRFAQAGLTITRQKYYLMSVVSAVAFAALAFVLIKHPAALPAGAVVGGLGFPLWVLNYLRNRRMKKFLEEFPNALDVITRGLKSGLPLNDCVRMIATEAAEPVKSEFRAMMDAQAVGISLGDAINDLYRRIPVPEANYFGIIIAIQQKSGGNLSETLANMSKVVRDRKKLKGKIQALSAEAKSSAGIIAAMPPAVATILYFTSPHYIEKLWTTDAGQFTLIGSAIWMLMGVLIMRKMINFQI
jgi:tight adherence protein B